MTASIVDVLGAKDMWKCRRSQIPCGCRVPSVQIKTGGSLAQVTVAWTEEISEDDGKLPTNERLQG
eukprot:653092-Amphidinium_carterae.1